MFTCDNVIMVSHGQIRGVLGKKFREDKLMFQEIEGGGHRLELKYIMCFVASASLACSSCLIVHSVCAN